MYQLMKGIYGKSFTIWSSVKSKETKNAVMNYPNSLDRSRIELYWRNVILLVWSIWRRIESNIYAKCIFNILFLWGWSKIYNRSWAPELNWDESSLYTFSFNGLVLLYFRLPFSKVSNSNPSRNKAKLHSSKLGANCWRVSISLTYCSEP